VDDSDFDRHCALQRAVFAGLGTRLAPGATVLDFGCGDGGLVRAYRRAGFDAYGCDIVLERETEHLRAIGEPYRLPFPDATFDAVVSDQVLEHVLDHRLAAKEIARVSRPSSGSLHIFPPPWRLVEAHVDVPLAGVLRNPVWLGLWARLGIRNPFQAGLSAREVARINREFLEQGVSRREDELRWCSIHPRDIRGVLRRCVLL
jgi:SAM-dependent methyltransferase